MKISSRGVAQRLPLSLRVTATQLYVKLLGGWYSWKLDQLEQQVEQTADAAAGPASGGRCSTGCAR